MHGLSAPIRSNRGRGRGDEHHSGSAVDASAAQQQNDYQNDPVVAQIVEILDTRIRPAVANDGGDIVFDRFEDGVLYLHMRGACAGCPSASMTLKQGVENMMRHFVPEVQEVRQVL